MHELDVRSRRRRQMILEGGLFKTLIILALPLALYNIFNYIYGFIDIMMVAHIGSSEVSSVVFIDQIKTGITAFGAGIAASGTVIVARYYGAGDIKGARKSAGLTFLLAVVISLIVVFLTVGFGPVILKSLGANEDIINTGLTYYNWNMIATSIMAVNSVFIGLEKAKGNTRIILILNVIMMLIKLLVSALFVYVLGGGINELSLATVIAQSSLMIFSIYFMFSKRNVFKIRFREIELDKELIMDILILAIPIFLGRFLFSMGKVVVNVIALNYHPYAVGAIGIAYKLEGVLGTIVPVFGESQMSVVSQNIGNKNLPRAIKTFKFTFYIASVVVVVGLLVNILLAPYILKVFNLTLEETNMVMMIYKWERYTIISSGLIEVVSGFFLGFKKTNVTFFLSMIRIFLFRVPILYAFFLYLPNTFEHIGMAMFISNSLTAIVGLLLWARYYRNLKVYGYQGLTLSEN